MITSWTPTPVQQFVTIRPGVSFPRMCDFARQIAHQKVFFFWGGEGSCNSLQPRPLDGFWCKIRQNSRFCARMCLFGVANINTSYDIASISETTTPIDKKFQDNICTTKICPAMQYCDVITNPRWWTAAILNIAKSPYLSEKSSDFDKIWYTTADIERNDSHVTRKKLRSNAPLGVYSNTVIGTWSLMGGILHLVQRGGAWVGCGPAQSPHRSTKCNSPPSTASVPTSYSMWHYNCLWILKVKWQWSGVMSIATC